MMNLAPISTEITPLAAATELLKRRRARASMLAFTEYTNPVYVAQWYHRLVCAYLDKFVSREIENLMIFYPPQHGKSTLVSRSLPAYIFGKKPDSKVIGASYAAELIQGMNRDVQRIMETPQYQKLFPETRLNSSNVRTLAGSFLRNNDIFEIVGRRGQYRCAGVGGGLTGFPCDFGIIDDPYKDYKEASSETVRRGVWEWYTSVFLSRTHVRTGKLITLTRWHENDLAGMLLELEPDKWTVLKLPALCEAPVADYDARQPGEALWPERFPVETLLERRALNPHQFEALYQQNPSPREGSFFKPDKIEIVDAAAAGLKIASAWDIGATEGDGDPTARVKMGTDGQGRFCILDAFAEQMGTDRRDARILQTAALDGKSVPQRLPQDPGAAGKSQAAAFVRLLAGYPVKTLPVSGDKMTRADPFSSQVNAGNVSMLKGDWNRAFLEELRQFPNGKHDDLCLAGESIVSTIEGGKPIKDVTAQDYVLTRKGYCRVLWAGMTSPSAPVKVLKLSNGRTLTGTSKHPIWVMGKGFVAIDTACDADILYVCRNTKPRQLLTRLFIRASRFIATRFPLVRRYGDIIIRMRATSEKAWAPFTAKYGKMPLALFPKGMIFTTKMGIRSIMTSRTLRPCLAQGTGEGMLPKGTIQPQPSAPILITSEARQQSGTVAQRGASGTSNTDTERQNRALHRLLHAPIVESRLSQRHSVARAKMAPVFVQGRVRQERAGKKGVSAFLRRVLSVPLNLWACRVLKPVPVTVESVCDGLLSIPVFNLTVEGEHEFYANGVLVHNCDAASDCFEELNAPKPMQAWFAD